MLPLPSRTTEARPNSQGALVLLKYESDEIFRGFLFAEDGDEKGKGGW